jgi:hypothetical protein
MLLLLLLEMSLLLLLVLLLLPDRLSIINQMVLPTKPPVWVRYLLLLLWLLLEMSLLLLLVLLLLLLLPNRLLTKPPIVRIMTSTYVQIVDAHS